MSNDTYYREDIYFGRTEATAKRALACLRRLNRPIRIHKVRQGDALGLVNTLKAMKGDIDVQVIDGMVVLSGKRPRTAGKQAEREGQMPLPLA